MPDFFLDDCPGVSAFTAPSPAISASSGAGSATPAAKTASAITDPELAKTFGAVQKLINEDLIKSVNAVYAFDLKGVVSFFSVVA